MSNAPDVESGEALPRGSDRALGMAGGFVSFLVFAAVRSPVPGVNEPHYLTKAKHFWNPDWCRGDFFLESSNAHLILYQTVGLLTQWFTLEQTAWIGRVLATLLLAVAWSEFISRLVPGRLSSLWVAWTFLALAAVGNFSGEWMVGGVEGKVFSYACVFWSLAFVLDGHWKRAALCAGLAVSFHAVVGVWSLVAAIVASSILPASRERKPKTPLRHSIVAAQTLLPVCLLMVAALPGLIPALRLLGSRSSEIAFEADTIQVFYRLAHHLNPTRFPTSAYLCYGLLTAFWLIGRRWAALRERETWWTSFVLGTVMIALTGLVIGLGSPPSQPTSYDAFRMQLMKFYPFRLADVMVPVAAAVVLVGLLQRWSAGDRLPSSRASRRRREWLCRLGFAGALLFALLSPVADKNPSKMSKHQLEDWHEACRWIAAETPADAHFLTPNESWAFKWYAQRAEFVVAKDCPQDARGIVEWNNRMHDQQDWLQRHSHNGNSAQALRRLHAEKGITHVIASSPEPFALELIYSNQTYGVFEIP